MTTVAVASPMQFGGRSVGELRPMPEHGQHTEDAAKGVRVSDVAKSREFYQKLGFEQSFEFNDPRKTPVSYMKVMITSFIELYQRKDDSQPLGLMHVCYEASDVEALQKEYVEREVKAPEPKKARAGNALYRTRSGRPNSRVYPVHAGVTSV